MRILVIEDDPASLELARYLLVSAGFDVDGAADGRAGLDAALRNEHDLILCDLQLPKLSGFEIIAGLRSSESWRAVPVIAVTAYSMPGDRALAMTAGFNGYLTKPIDPDGFLVEVGRYLRAAPGSG